MEAFIKCDVCGEKAKIGFQLEDGTLLNFCQECICRVGTMTDEEKDEFFANVMNKE